MTTRIVHSDENIDYLTVNNNEFYEKLRPLECSSTTKNDEQMWQDQAHGDELSKEEECEDEMKSPRRQIFFVEHSSNTALDETDQSIRSVMRPNISPLSSSSSDELSSEIPVATAEYSNEELKTDDENQMTKSYFRYSIKNHIQQDDEKCEYEIDLGNGSITKSNSFDKQQRISSIISADSVQPTTIHPLPFTNAYYEEPQHRPKEYVVYHDRPTHIIFNSTDLTEEKNSSIKSLNNVTIASISIFVSLIIILFVTFLV